MAAGNNADKSARRVDANKYKELQAQQTEKAQQIIQSSSKPTSNAKITYEEYVSSGAGAQAKPQGQVNQGKKKVESGQNWRMGKFHDDADDNQYFSEQAHVDSQTGLNSAIKVVEEKVSKHAARRRKKKAAIISQGPIMDENEPSLNDL